MNKYQLLSLQVPSGVVGTVGWWGNLERLLPAKAREKEWQLIDMHYEQPEYSKDPVILFDRDGHILLLPTR